MRPGGSARRRAGWLLAPLLAAAALVAVDAAQAQQLCNGRADLCSRPFSETVFAGTHNSMAADDYGWSFSVTTQTHTLRRQLDDGIRALSLDIHYAAPGFLGGVYNEDGPTRGSIAPYLCHNQCLLGSLRLTLGLDAIAGFLAANRNEVVVIYVEDYVTPDDLARDLQASQLWPYVHDGPLTRTLGEMIALNRRVVLIAQNRTSAYTWYPKLTAIGRDTDYDFTSTDQLTNPANHWNSCRPTPWGAAGRGRILVMTHFVTPTTTGSRSASAVVNQRDVVTARALKCRERHGVMPSLVFVDYYEYGDIRSAVSALNDLYVAPAPGAPPACVDVSACGDDPERPEPGCVDCSGATVASGTAPARFSQLRLRAQASPSLAPGGRIRITVSARNTGGTTAVLPVRLIASRPRALELPARVRLRVPAGETASRTVAVRAARGARGGVVVISAEVDGLESRLSVRIRSASRTPSVVAG